MAFSRNIFVALLVAFTACNAFAEEYSGLQLSARDITTLAALKVTPEYVQEMRSYFPEISARDITSLYALKVTPDYLKEMRTHFSDISVKDVTSLYALKVPPSYVKEIHDLGYADITTQEITSFYALKVKPDYIAKMRKAGKVAGHQVHVPEVHVNVPEIEVPEIQVHVASAHHGSPHASTTWRTIFKTAIGTIILLGLGIFLLRKYIANRASVPDENMDSRMTDFENRVNDLQDILLSIDARLDRRLKRS